MVEEPLENHPLAKLHQEIDLQRSSLDDARVFGACCRALSNSIKLQGVQRELINGLSLTLCKMILMN